MCVCVCVSLCVCVCVRCGWLKVDRFTNNLRFIFNVVTRLLHALRSMLQCLNPIGYNINGAYDVTIAYFQPMNSSVDPQIYIYINIYIYGFTHSLSLFSLSLSLSIYIYIFIYVHMWVHYIYMHVCM